MFIFYIPRTSVSMRCIVFVTASSNLLQIIQLNYIVLSLCIDLHEMERRSVCETASLDGVGASGAMPRGSCYATERAYPTLCFFSEKRLRFISSPRCHWRRYSGINTRFPIGSTIRAFSIIAVLRGNGQRSRNSLGSFAGKFDMLIFYYLS